MTDRRTTETDIFQHRYYKINKLYLSSLGLWPYQNRRKRFILIAFLVLLATSEMTPQIIAVVEFRNDPEVIAESTVALVMILGIFIKLCNIVVNSDKMLQIFQRIEIDWISVGQQPEINVLRYYAKRGRQFTITYTVGACFSAALFDCRPILPRVMEFMKLTNETLPKTLLFPADYYGLDFDTFYYYFLVHEYIGAVIVDVIIIVVDTTFIIQVQHACGMFAVVGNSYSHHLKRMTNDITEEYPNCSQRNLDPAFRHLSYSIRLHSDAIAFSDMIEASYTWAFLITVGINLLAISFVGVQTLLLMDMKSEQATRYGISIVAFISHLLFLSFFSQRLMDHSLGILEDLCQTEWYRTSLATQKLLNLVIMRARVPCQLTAGKFMTMSMENFAAVLKTSMSYFTVLRSMQ